MKTYLVILFIALFLNSCTKENFSKNILGKWELRDEYTIGHGGGVYPPGNGYIYEFTPGSYKWDYHGTVYKTGSYKIGKDTVYGQIPCNHLYLENDGHSNIFISMKGKKMTLIFQSRHTTVMHLENISY